MDQECETWSGSLGILEEKWLSLQWFSESCDTVVSALDQGSILGHAHVKNKIMLIFFHMRSCCWILVEWQVSTGYSGLRIQNRKTGYM